MIFKKFHIRVIFHVLLILLNCVWISFEIFHPPNVYTLILLSSLLILQIYLLVRYVNRTNREISRIFSALWDQDTSFSLAPGDRSESFNEIARVINESRQQIQEARIDKEKQYRYLQFIINHMNIGLLSFHGDGRVEHYNRSAGELTGKKELSSIAQLNALHPGLERILLHMEPGQSRIITISAPPESRQLLLRMTQLVYEGQPVKLLSLQDIRTELDEQELLSWKRLIRVLNHEVMNSLTPIRTLTHAIERSLKELDPRESDLAVLADIRTNSQLISKRSSSLIEFVKRYREISNIRMISREPVAVLPMLQEIRDLYRNELKQRNCVLRISVEPSHLRLRGDENMLKQVMINLIQNSMHALEEHTSGNIDIKGHQEAGRVLISVKDNGPGISPEYMDDIFTPFFSTKEAGSGIGLSFSRHIVRLHDGNISIHSDPGKGTTVIMRFNQQN
jgi:nitrogen fixation/metabolism regulation signal transduction histidine kinase